jgi:acetylornithine/succinyldiaminopimelate/putrescine aminotransferase
MKFKRVWHGLGNCSLPIMKMSALTLPSLARRFRAAFTLSLLCWRTKPFSDLFQPGEHGSTFGGNPLAAAVARASLRVIREEKLAERSAELGTYFIEQLSEIPSPHVKEVRGRGC